MSPKENELRKSVSSDAGEPGIARRTTHMRNRNKGNIHRLVAVTFAKPQAPSVCPFNRGSFCLPDRRNNPFFQWCDARQQIAAVRGDIRKRQIIQNRHEGPRCLLKCA